MLTVIYIYFCIFKIYKNLIDRGFLSLSLCLIILTINKNIERKKFGSKLIWNYLALTYDEMIEEAIYV